MCVTIHSVCPQTTTEFLFYSPRCCRFACLCMRVRIYVCVCVCSYDTQVPRARHTTHVSENEPTWYVYEKQQKRKRMNRCRVQVRQKSCCGNIYVRFCRWISIHTAHSTHGQIHWHTHLPNRGCFMTIMRHKVSFRQSTSAFRSDKMNEFKFYEFRSTIRASQNFKIVSHQIDWPIIVYHILFRCRKAKIQYCNLSVSIFDKKSQINSTETKR